jgi:hypothetical protein
MVGTKNSTLLAFSRLISSLFFLGHFSGFAGLLTPLWRRNSFSKLKVLNENRTKIKMRAM